MVADDLRDQLRQRLSRRTGIRVLDDSMGGAGGATYRLRGRVRIAAERGRVSLSLYLKDSAQPMWSKSYDDKTKDVFTFCDHLVDRVDTDLRVQINAFDGNRIAHLKDDELSVSELRSRAATLFYEYTVASWERARSVLKRGISLAPGDPMASAMHAEAIVALSRKRDMKLCRPRLPRAWAATWMRPWKLRHAVHTSFGPAPFSNCTSEKI